MQYFCILIYIPVTPPLGNCNLLNNMRHMGYRWIRLDPQGPKTWVASRISGPDQRGRRRQVPGGPEPGHPQGLIFWKSCWSKGCSACKTGLVSGFSGHPGPSGWSPAQKTPRCRARARTYPGSEFLEWLHEKDFSGLFRMIIMAISRCFRTARTIWVKSSTKDTKV